MGERIQFETPEDVHLEFDLAGPGSRVAAAMVDYCVIVVFIGGILAILVAAGAIAFSVRDLFDPDTWSELSGFALAVVVGVIFGVNLSYFVFSEWLLSGQSLGKKLLGLRVVRDGGYALSFSASFVRNIARLVDMLPGPYFVGIVSVILSSERKRLGDFMGGTIVVRHQTSAAPVPRFVGERYATHPHRQFVLTREHLARLGPDTLLLLDGYYDRVESLAEVHAAELRLAIATGVARRMGLDLDPDADADRLAAFLKESYLALRETL